MPKSGQRMNRWKSQALTLHSVVGAAVGLFVLHPVTMTIYWFEFSIDGTERGTLFLEILGRTFMSFETEMWTMAMVYVVIGSVFGYGSGMYTKKLLENEKRILSAQTEIEQTLDVLLGSGENSRVEFKSSMRWDRRQNMLNKSLEQVIVKTIAGFLNADGGVLVIGVDDDGKPLGLIPDYTTLKGASSDGFTQHIMHLVSHRIGADLCQNLMPRFHTLDGLEICTIVIERSDRPVYVDMGEQAKYYLRTGNTTRELNTRDAVAHINRRSQSI